MKHTIILIVALSLAGCGHKTIHPLDSKPVADPSIPLRTLTTGVGTAAEDLTPIPARIRDAVGGITKAAPETVLPALQPFLTSLGVQADVIQHTRDNLAGLAPVGVKAQADVKALAKSNDVATAHAVEADKEIAQLKEDASKGWAKTLDGWALVLTLAGVGLGIAAAWVAFGLGSPKGAMLMGAGAATLIGGAAVLHFLAVYWVWVEVATGLVALGGAIYFVVTRLDLHNKNTTLQTLVPAIEKSGIEVAGLVKDQIKGVAVKAGTFSVVKSTIGKVKDDLGIVSQPGDGFPLT